jgi:hypothetical protein
MATFYAYSFKHAFFNNRKKELFSILLKQICSFRILATARIVRILAYQTLLPLRKKLPLGFTKTLAGVE